MKRYLLGLAWALAGIGLALGLTFGAYAIAGRDLADPTSPVAPRRPLSSPADTPSSPGGLSGEETPGLSGGDGSGSGSDSPAEGSDSPAEGSEDTGGSDSSGSGSEGCEPDDPAEDDSGLDDSGLDDSGDDLRDDD